MKSGDGPGTDTRFRDRPEDNVTAHVAAQQVNIRKTKDRFANAAAHRAISGPNTSDKSSRKRRRFCLTVPACGVINRHQQQSIAICQAALKETRAWLDFEILQVLEDREERDLAYFGRIRHKLEKTLAGSGKSTAPSKGVSPQ